MFWSNAVKLTFSPSSKMIKLETLLPQMSNVESYLCGNSFKILHPKLWHLIFCPQFSSSFYPGMWLHWDWSLNSPPPPPPTSNTGVTDNFRNRKNTRRVTDLRPTFGGKYCSAQISFLLVSVLAREQRESNCCMFIWNIPDRSLVSLNTA